MLERLAIISYRRRWRVVGAWLVVLAVTLVAAGAFGGSVSDGGSLPGTDAQAAFDLVHANMPDRSGESTIVVFEAPNGIADPATQTAIDGFVDQVKQLPGVTGVDPPGDQVSPDGTITFATVDFVNTNHDTDLDAAAAGMKADAQQLRDAGIQTEFSGFLFASDSMPASEVIGIIAAVVILLLTFGSVVAMGLPIGTAILGVVIGVGGVTLWSAVVETPGFVGPVATMISLGVGIDYALFIVTRARAAQRRGATPEEATVEAVSRAGRAVLFAGGTVIISLLGLLVMGVSFLHGLAYGASTAVAVAVAAALTLLPALLGFAGTKIDTKRARRRAARPKETIAHRWGRTVQRRPKAAALVGAGILIALAGPVLSMHLASADEGNAPADSTNRKAYDTLAEGFGPGFNGPLLVVLQTPPGTSDQAVEHVVDAVRNTEDVVLVTPPTPSPNGAVTVFSAFPGSSPQSVTTEALVHHLRHDVLPGATAGTGLEAHVGGETAVNVDFASVLGGRLPWFIGTVLVFSFLLLLVVFRSVLVPLKAVVMNVLSIAAAYGVMVAVFQWGWLGSVFNVTPAPVEPWAPMLLFAIVFGLSMDYEVFLLSSVREEYDRTGDSREAVVEGLASTARVITAAAAIMVCVFGSFVVADDRALKLIGLGLAVAVLVDATIVRMVLVPATMELLGDRNWWLPRWLDRLLPHFQIEEPGPAAVPAAAGAWTETTGTDLDADADADTDGQPVGAGRG